MSGGGKALLLIGGAVVVAPYLIGRYGVQFKGGVKPQGVQPQIWWALGVAEALRALSGASGELTVTSLADSTHGPGSLHPPGMAADLRTFDLSPSQIATWFSALKSFLSRFGFDVVKEVDHIHVEYQPKPGGGSLPALFGG